MQNMSDDDRYRRFNLRIPKELFAQLQEQADVRSHSMNAEIIQRLERSLKSESIEGDSLDLIMRASELYKNAYDLHDLMLRTHDETLRSTLAQTRDELTRQFEQIMQKSGYSDKIGKYPWG